MFIRHSAVRYMARSICSVLSLAIFAHCISLLSEELRTCLTGNVFAVVSINKIPVCKRA